MSDTSKTILIAEDERAISKALQLKLTKLGYEVTAVFNGKQALDMLSSMEYDLVLLDLMMPEVDGFAVLEQLQKDKKNQKVIVSSNLSQDSDFAKAKELGAIDYYVKSNTSISEVVDHVQKAIDA